MIDKRFSSEEFEKLGRDTDEANALHKELANEIASVINEVTRPAFTALANELRALGHSLDEDDPVYDEEYSSWGYTFRDVGNDRGIFDHKLRVHLDTQISTGYPNEKTEAEVLKELNEEFPNEDI